VRAGHELVSSAKSSASSPATESAGRGGVDGPTSKTTTVELPASDDEFAAARSLFIAAGSCRSAIATFVNRRHLLPSRTTSPILPRRDLTADYLSVISLAPSSSLSTLVESMVANTLQSTAPPLTQQCCCCCKSCSCNRCYYRQLLTSTRHTNVYTRSESRASRRLQLRRRTSRQLLNARPFNNSFPSRVPVAIHCTYRLNQSAGKNC